MLALHFATYAIPSGMESSFVFVRRAREKLGLTQAQFAERLDMHRSTINRYENGERLPLHARMAIERLLELEDK